MDEWYTNIKNENDAYVTTEKFPSNSDSNSKF